MSETISLRISELHLKLQNCGFILSTFFEAFDQSHTEQNDEQILLLCVLFAAGSPLTCKWMDRDFQQYSERSLALLKIMKNNSTNSTDDAELDDAVAFPNELYRHASKESRTERLSFVAHVLDEIMVLFEEDQTHAPWSSSAAEDFLNVISQQANGVRSCVSSSQSSPKIFASHAAVKKIVLNSECCLYFGQAGIGKHTHHKKNQRKMTMYFKRSHSADAWELVRKEIRLHLYRVHRVATA
ncbi:hypothetical protein WMY93_010630 [Mugilogobius chulae]|uniref:Uncharacterized protein n=1 Tax=Mugilogobius chulae TaxID=88201 RepID=A0AAW0PJH0_9GOBI